MVVSGDGWKQHFTAFVYFGQYGRTVLRTLLTEHQLVLPQWNFSLGYGGDILTTLHYYVIGDPLDLLSIACPTRYAVYLYSFLSLFRLYLAGLGFGAFCLYKKQGAPLSIAVGGVCYVFFTYSFLMVARHPFLRCPWSICPYCCWAWSRYWLSGVRISLFSPSFWQPSAISISSICWH